MFTKSNKFINHNRININTHTHTHAHKNNKNKFNLLKRDPRDKNIITIF